MIIKDVNGGRLRLSGKRLTEIDGMLCSQYPNWIILKELKNGFDKPTGKIQLYCSICPQGRCITADYDFDLHYIGCRTFSPATFAKILKVAGVKVTRKKKAK